MNKILMGLIAVISLSTQTHAVNRTWTGTSVVFNAPVNWGGTAPGPSDTGIFGNVPGKFIVAVDTAAAQEIDGFVVNSDGYTFLNLETAGFFFLDTGVTGPSDFKIDNRTTLSFAGSSQAMNTRLDNKTTSIFEIAGPTRIFQLGALEGAGTVRPSTADQTLCVGGRNIDTRFSGNFIDNGQQLSLTKKGTGTFIVTGNGHTYSGPTDVQQGTLQWDSPATGSSSNFSVQSGATLSGIGFIDGDLENNGKVMPGNPVDPFKALEVAGNYSNPNSTGSLIVTSQAGVGQSSVIVFNTTPNMSNTRLDVTIPNFSSATKIQHPIVQGTAPIPTANNFNQGNIFVNGGEAIPFLNVQTFVDPVTPDAILLDISPVPFAPGIQGIPGVTGDSAAVAFTFDTITANGGPTDPVLNGDFIFVTSQVRVLPVGQVPFAFDQMGSDSQNTQTTVNLNSGNQINNVVNSNTPHDTGFSPFGSDISTAGGPPNDIQFDTLDSAATPPAPGPQTTTPRRSGGGGGSISVHQRTGKATRVDNTPPSLVSRSRPNITSQRLSKRMFRQVAYKLLPCFAPQARKYGFQEAALMLKHNMGSAQKDLGRHMMNGNSGVGNLWFQGFGGKSDAERTMKDLGFHASTAGVMMGFDYQVQDDLRLGAGGGYSHSNINVRRNLAHTSVKSPFGSVWGQYDFADSYQANLAVTYRKNVYDTKRYTFLSRTSRGRHKGYEILPSLRVTRQFWVAGATQLTPFIETSYFHSKEEGYQENGAGFLSLKVKPKTSGLLQSALGFGMSRRMCLPMGVFTPHLEASYRNRYTTRATKTTSSFAGTNVLFVSTADDKTLHRMGAKAGINFVTHGGAYFSLTYLGDYGEGQKSHTGMFTIGKSW